MTLITLGPAWLAGILLARWLAPPLAVLALLAVPTLAALLLDRASLPIVSQPHTNAARQS
jgi:hypothetical protein